MNFEFKEKLGAYLCYPFRNSREISMQVAMANKSDSHNTNFVEFPPISPLNPTPSSSTPIHLSGFVSGDTVEVRADTGELQFSVQFNVHKKEHNTSNFQGDVNTLEIEKFHNSALSSSSSSTYLTPNSANGIRNESMAENEVMSESRHYVVTRLRSGVLSPVSYKVNKAMNHDGLRESLSSGKKKRKATQCRNVRVDDGNVFDKMLKRRSIPLRPCNSYGFFLMANWSVVKFCSFEETSKKLSRKWSKLPNNIKKEYEEMALKDSARYKRQCRNNLEEGTTCDETVPDTE